MSVGAPIAMSAFRAGAAGAADAGVIRPWERQTSAARAHLLDPLMPLCSLFVIWCLVRSHALYVGAGMPVMWGGIRRESHRDQQVLHFFRRGLPTER